MKKIIILSLLLFGFAPVAFSAGNYLYESIGVDIAINKDSTFDVVESQTYLLDGNFGFFYRDIELKRLDHISDIEVFDSNGNKLDKYDISYKGNKLHIQWNFERRDFNNELKSWKIKYKVHGGLGFYKDYDELYWNAIFSDRTVPVKNAEVIVRSPAKITGLENYVGYAGTKNQTKNYELIGENTARFFESNLLPDENLTIVVTWPKGFAIKPAIYRNQVINWAILIVGLIISVVISAKTFVNWNRFGKDAKISKTIIAQYEPPDNLSPALMGILVKQRADVKGILATMVDLAVKGYLRIREVETKVLFIRKKEYAFERLKNSDGLRPYEQKVMDAIFSGKSEVLSSELKNKFYARMPGINKAMYDEMGKGSGYFNANILKIRNRYRAVYLIAFFASFFIGFISLIFSGPFSSAVFSSLMIIDISLIIGFIVS